MRSKEKMITLIKNFERIPIKTMEADLKKSNEKNNTGKSPLEDIPRIKLNITTQEIVELLRECRSGI